MLEILVLTYNHGKYIKKTLTSILSQDTSFSFIIKVFDDCSTDNTIEVIKSIRNQDSRVHLIQRKSNLGSVKNFYQSINECESEFLAFCEGDDYWIDKNKLQTQLNFLLKNKDCSAIFSNCRYSDENDQLYGDFLNGRIDDFDERKIITASEYLKARLRPLHISSSVFRSKEIRFPKKYLTTPILDTPFLIYNCFKGRVVLEKRITAAYRKHPKSITEKNSFSLDYVLRLRQMFLWLNEEMEYSLTKETKVAINNRYFLAHLEFYKEGKRNSLIQLILLAIKKSSYDLRDLFWLLKNR